MGALPAAALLVLALAAFAIDLRFLEFFRPMPPVVADPLRHLLRACGGEGATCADVVRSRFSRLFGVPNPLLGALWHAAVAALAAAALATGSLPLRPWATGAALAVLAVSVVLALALVLVLRVPCRLCMTAHALNAAVAAVLLLG